MKLQAPRGTRDIFGVEMARWRMLEDIIRDLTDAYGFTEIRTPIFEHTELFVRGVGETTDIVTKEMYTFTDKGDRSITLKPETTAGAARAFIEHGVFAKPQPTKWFYISPTFRYEKPEAGRYRQHYQFGIELYGSYDAAADAEVISLAHEFLSRAGIKNVYAHINSIGCKACRAEYNKKLVDYLNVNIDCLCETCKERMGKNPLRVLDCKKDGCKGIILDAPTTLESLDADCLGHFEKLQSHLINLKVPFIIDKFIVRGLDYYTKTVFEFISNDIGSQGTVCAGGRYDNLITQVGGPETGAVGFGAGIDRLVLLLEKMNKENTERKPKLFIAYIGEKGYYASLRLAGELRKHGIYTECNLLDRGVKAQLKYADKIGAEYCLVIGDDEVDNGVVSVKEMATGKSEDVKMDELVGFFDK
jgi:histidyl-tRNA synthetase